MKTTRKVPQYKYNNPLKHVCHNIQKDSPNRFVNLFHLYIVDCLHCSCKWVISLYWQWSEGFSTGFVNYRQITNYTMLDPKIIWPKVVMHCSIISLLNAVALAFLIGFFNIIIHHIAVKGTQWHMYMLTVSVPKMPVTPCFTHVFLLGHTSEWSLAKLLADAYFE